MPSSLYTVWCNISGEDALLEIWSLLGVKGFMCGSRKCTVPCHIHLRYDLQQTTTTSFYLPQGLRTKKLRNSATTYETALEFANLCSNRWPKIAPTQQKSRRAYFSGTTERRLTVLEEAFHGVGETLLRGVSNRRHAGAVLHEWVSAAVQLEKYREWLASGCVESDQFQISPAASPAILHHTVWRTWLSIAYSDERWFYCQFSLPHLYISL